MNFSPKNEIWKIKNSRLRKIKLTIKSHGNVEKI